MILTPKTPSILSDRDIHIKAYLKSIQNSCGRLLSRKSYPTI